MVILLSKAFKSPTSPPANADTDSSKRYKETTNKALHNTPYEEHVKTTQSHPRGDSNQNKYHSFFFKSEEP
jgi:hypothetical protein